MRSFFARLESLFAAAAFAEEGDADTARRLATGREPGAPAAGQDAGAAPCADAEPGRPTPLRPPSRRRARLG